MMKCPRVAKCYELCDVRVGMFFGGGEACLEKLKSINFTNERHIYLHVSSVVVFLPF